MEAVVDYKNLTEAFKQVKRNDEEGGVDGMDIEGLQE